MKKQTNIVSIIIFSILLTSCGFKKINDRQNQIHIQNINITGKKSTIYVLKNNILLISDKNSSTKFMIEMKTTESKAIKIKNISGKTTRYNLSINADLILKNVNSLKELNKSFSKNYDYEVATNHSSTIENEKNARKNLINQLSDAVINFIIFSTKVK